MKRKTINDLTFMELWQEYEKFIRVKLKSQSYRKEVSAYNLHILPYFKAYKVKDITSDVYLNWMLEIEKCNYKYSYNSSLHIFMVSILNYAVKFYKLDSNVASLIGNFNKNKSQKVNVDFWTYEEYQKFISVIDNKMYKLFFETLYFTGARLGECIALTWNDFKDNYIDINKTISKEKDVNGNYIINSPKTPSSYRKIELDNYIINSFNELYKEQSKNVDFDNNWYIFGGKKPLTQTTITRRKDLYCKKADVKKIRLHDFRHSHATLLLSMNVPIPVISKRLGHSNITTTLDTYSHLILTDEDKAINIINELKSNNNETINVM